MTIALKTSTGYISCRTFPDGVLRWSVMSHNQPLCAPCERLRDVLTVAQQTFGRATLEVWDGDKGEFVSELVADPTY